MDNCKCNSQETLKPSFPNSSVSQETLKPSFPNSSVSQETLKSSFPHSSVSQHYNGYNIREGAESIFGEQLRILYEGVGWVSHKMPTWQNEMLEFAFKNSTWIFPVWYNSELNLFFILKIKN